MKKIMLILTILILALILIGAGIYFYAKDFEPYHILIEEETVMTDEKIHDCTVVFFSDTHYGKWYDPENIDMLAEKINAQNPEIVILGGDLIDNYNRDQDELDVEKIEEGLKSIEAKYGKYAVFGNHDYGGGAEWPYREILDQADFTLLVDKNVYIKELNITVTGFDDLLFGDSDPSFYKLDTKGLDLLVCHEPDLADNLEINGNDSYMFAGHSHGGQVNLPFLSDYYLPDGATQYVKGWYKGLGILSNIQLYVSRGIGMTGLPFRFLSYPEITVLHLKTKQQ